jgi:selenide,water dikinase
MHAAPPLTRDLVLIGGGHAHALVLKQWGMRPLPGARLTLIDPDPATAYTGMLPGFVAGHYAREDLDIDLVRLARFAGARIILDRVTGLDSEARRIDFKNRASIRFDIASVDIGATGRSPDIEGFTDHVVTAKPLSGFADRWRDFVERVAQGEAQPRVAVIGAGAAGIELALAAQHRLATLGADPHVTLIEAQAAIGPDLTSAARRHLHRALLKAGVDIRPSARVLAIDTDGIQLETETIAADFIIGAAGVQPWPWIAQTGLALEAGYVRVDKQLRSVSHPHVFAAGDCAHLDVAPRPKAGVYAVRAAPVLADNLRAVLQGQRPARRFKPQGDYLKLISTGGQSAVAEKHGLALAAPALWRLKNSIDQDFMERLRDLTPMPPPRLGGPMADGVQALAEDAQPLCGGCGSKTGRGALSEGLAGLSAPQRDDVLVGAGDDAAVLKAGDRQQVITTDHLRAFIEDPGLFARITAVHALGDVWSSGAEPQAALATIILPPMTESLQAAMMAEIMAAAGDVFADAGADIVGGHTSTGGELSLGFTVTGLTGQAVRQGAAQPGDILLLTKPIGTGVVLAGEMALKAKGRDAAACWANMARPQGKAAALLTSAATAMTDVTGFGLAGHLSTLLGEAGAELDLAAVPLLPGALALAERGVRSTLFEANQLPAEVLDAPDTPLADLLVDPQTAGGLLAAVRSDALEAVLAAFEQADEPVWRIGSVVTRAHGAAKIVAR